ncbi:hypothetical protein [Caballeronia sp.]|jgi:predicted lipoprotein with Yx(FWY)xxD motif|uniref:hypothetical protein n=1 Tax=Caballeronia sp. TaxID=1931223 RepID=UPI003C381C50
MKSRLSEFAAALATSFALSAYAGPPMAANGIFADSNDMTLYTFDKDPASGPSACTGSCAKVWPASMADASDKPSGDLKADNFKDVWARREVVRNL